MSDSKIPDIQRADLAVVMGSGYTFDSSGWTKTGSIPYGKIIPNHIKSAYFESQSADYFKNENGKTILIFTSRFHRYQGFTPKETTLPVQIAFESGAKKILLTNAAGGLNESFKTGDFVVIDKLLVFPAIPDGFSNEKNPFDNSLVEKLKNSVKETTSVCNVGTYAFMPGPAYETFSEVDFLKRMGADVVGMSTAYEALYAASKGIETAAMSLITNAHSKNVHVKLSHRDVLSETSKSNKTFNMILSRFLKLVL